MFPDEQLTHIS